MVVPDFIINYGTKYRMGDRLRETTRHQVPLFLLLGEVVEYLTDSSEKFPVGNKMI